MDRQILQHNLYGVDLNDEAVDICRLSLWIKTAQAGKVLTSLDHNIRVGNSVIADPAVHPEGARLAGRLPRGVRGRAVSTWSSANPPYVRQEWISAIQALSASSTTAPSTAWPTCTSTSTSWA